MDQQPQEQSRKALFAQHLKIGGVKGAGMIGGDCRLNILMRAAAFRIHPFIAQLVLQIGLEATAKRMILNIIPCPGPNREPG